MASARALWRGARARLCVWILLIQFYSHLFACSLSLVTTTLHCARVFLCCHHIAAVALCVCVLFLTQHSRANEKKVKNLLILPSDAQMIANVLIQRARPPIRRPLSSDCCVHMSRPMGIFPICDDVGLYCPACNASFFFITRQCTLFFCIR